MLNEILYSLNPINWDYNTVSSALNEAFWPEMFLLFFLVFAVSLIRLVDYNKDSIIPHICYSVVIALFFFIRFYGADNIFVFILPLINIVFVVIRQIVRHLEFEMYNLKSKSKMKNFSNDNPPMPVQIFLIFATSLGRVLFILPMFYLMLAFEQFETNPSMLIVVIGILAMLYSILSLLSCLNTVKERIKADEEQERREGYINKGRFKRTQSPVQFYEMLYQLGMVFCGILFYIGVGQWFMVLLGVFLSHEMLKKHAQDHENTRHLYLKADNNYKKYNRTTPIFYPFWPKYTLLKKDIDAVITKTVTSNSADESESSDSDKKSKKKRPPKSERPKKEPKEKKSKEPKKEGD